MDSPTPPSSGTKDAWEAYASKLFTVFYIFIGISLIGALLNEFLKRHARRVSDRASED